MGQGMRIFDEQAAQADRDLDVNSRQRWAQDITVVRLPPADCSDGFGWDGPVQVAGTDPIQYEERGQGWTLRRKS